ncbi:hypothetical protein [Spirosoma gilvum]
MKLDFWGILALVFCGGLLVVAFRLIWWLALGTERVIAFMTQFGLHTPAKLLLAILIGYDEQTYQKSRFIFWNQAHVRFAILWGCFLLLAGLLVLLQQSHVVGNVGLTWLLTFMVYVGLRCLVYWSRPKPPLIYTEEPSLKSLIKDVNERSPFPKRSGRQLIRRYDYLDELFAETA